MKYDILAGLSRIKEEMKFNTKQLSAKCQKSPDNISGLLHGSRKAGIQLYSHISMRLGVSLKELIGFTPDEKFKDYLAECGTIPKDQQCGEAFVLKMLANDGNGDYLKNGGECRVGDWQPTGARRVGGYGLSGDSSFGGGKCQ